MRQKPWRCVRCPCAPWIWCCLGLWLRNCFYYELQSNIRSWGCPRTRWAAHARGTGERREVLSSISRGLRGHLKHLCLQRSSAQPSCCHKEQSVSRAMWSWGRLPRTPRGLPASELLIPWLWGPELQRKGSILPAEAWSKWPHGFLFSGISRATVGRDNRGCCPGLAQRHRCQMQSWLPRLILAAPALLIIGCLWVRAIQDLCFFSPPGIWALGKPLPV